MRGERLPGAEKSTKCGGQQQQTEQVEEDDNSGCYICIALGRPSFMTHSVERCIKKEQFSNKMKDPAQQEEQVKRLATRPEAARDDQTSDRAGMQQNSARNPKQERSAQSQQSEMPNPQQMQQVNIFRVQANQCQEMLIIHRQWCRAMLVKLSSKNLAIRDLALLKVLWWCKLVRKINCFDILIFDRCHPSRVC